MKVKVREAEGHPFLFVYGTLMRGFDEDLRNKIGAKLIGEGAIKGRLYDLGDYPGAKVAENSSKNLVKGELYQLNDPERATKVLDRYEDCFPSEPHRSLFIRKLVTVSLKDGRKRRAWTYLYNRPTRSDKLIPSGDYRSRVAARPWS